MDKRFWAVVVAVLVIFGGIFWTTSNKTDAPSGGKTDQPSNHVEGENTTGVTLVEYGDYECPGCAQYFQPVKDVVEKYKEKISFQYRHFPLTQIHQNAFAASRAAEAAGMQGKFWEMHDVLFKQNVAYQASGQKLNTWITSSDPLTVFTGYAKQLGLDTKKFKTDFSSDKTNSTINADIAAGSKLGVSSTPTFFLDGKKIEPSPSVESFSRFIDDAIKTKAGN